MKRAGAKQIERHIPWNDGIGESMQKRPELSLEHGSVSDGDIWRRAGFMLKAVSTVPTVLTVRYAEMFRSLQELASTIGAGSGAEVSTYAYGMYGTVGNRDTELAGACRYDGGSPTVRTVRTVPRVRSGLTRGARRGHVDERRWTDDDLRSGVLTQAERSSDRNSDGIKNTDGALLERNAMLTILQFKSTTKE